MAAAVATPMSSGANRRKSGRAVHAPQIFSQEHHQGSVLNTAKRKLNDAFTNGEINGPEDKDSSESESAESEPDEEELRERRRQQQQKSRSKGTTKPAAKRPKTKAAPSTTLAIRSANVPKKNVTKVAQKKARARPSQVEATGLFADVFGKGNDADTAATSWYNKLEGDHVAGIMNAVNFVLQTIGCNAKVTQDDINDVDNIPDRLTDILEQYAEQKEGDFPLSGKQRQYHGMKEVFIEFFTAIPHVLHNSRLMYEEVAVYDNLHVWLATMSGAQYRSFRFTATVASLAMSTGQAEVAKEVQASITASKHQLDTEQKKKPANKSRITKLQEEMARDEKRLEVIDGQLKDEFETVYIHRYRDVDEKLRVECARSLGLWIQTYRHHFLDGHYLRYLGWVISDPNAETRLEVIRQLKAIYKIRGNLAQLRGFTDRFRWRLVEMGEKDADLSVRVETIELLNILRSAQLLEPGDVDTVGKLIFDIEPPVRNAVAQFFVSNIEDLYAAIVEDFETEEYEAALPKVEEVDDFDEPCRTWIKFKCLAQTLAAQADENPGNTNRHSHIGEKARADTKYTIATQAVFNHIEELTEWESLAGYLIFDHSSISTRETADIGTRIQHAYKLDVSEELILLDVLYCAAKLYIKPPVLEKPKTKAEKQEFQERQETAAHNLSAFIPKLHSKFGSIPQAVKSVLRLNQLLNPDLLEAEEEEGQGEISQILSDISKHFTSHADDEVIAEATRALQAALLREASRELALQKVDEIFTELLTFRLSPLVIKDDNFRRGTLNRDQTQQLADVMKRLAQLASVKDCCSVIEGKLKWIARANTKNRKETVAYILIRLVKRGMTQDAIVPDINKLEDQIFESATKTLLFYYRWAVVAIKKSILRNDASTASIRAIDTLAAIHQELGDSIGDVVMSRDKKLDPVRVFTLMSIIDLHVLPATLKTLQPEKGTLDEILVSSVQAMRRSKIDDVMMEYLMETHEAMEKRLAQRLGKKNVQLLRKKKRTVDEPRAAVTGETLPVNDHDSDEDVDRPPEDSDDEAETQRRKTQEEEDSTTDGGDRSDAEDGLSAKDAKRKVLLVAETELCELTAKIVLGLLAGVIPDVEEVKARLQLNRTKLGKSYTQVIAYADEKKEKKSKSKSAAPKTPVKKLAKKAAPAISKPMVVDEDDIEDSDGEQPREDDDPQVLAEQGLGDDPAEEADDDEPDDIGTVNGEDEDIMGD